MRVQVWIENSEGVEVCVFNEHVREEGQEKLLINVLASAKELDEDIRKFVESMGEDP